MVYDYVVTLRNTNRRLIDRISLLALSVSIIFFIAEGVLQRTTASSPIDRFFIITHVLAPLSVIIVIIVNQLKRRKGRLVYYQPALYFAAIGWVAMPYLSWLALPLIVMALIERQAKFNLEVGFYDGGVVINTFFRKRKAWSEFSNIVLKDDLLTLDYKNNRIFQRETIDEEGEADEDEFNEYCRARVEFR